ncbi:hypothetical protein E4665_00135 [Sporolactobacillus shoreae]|uniref:Teichoic acid biosynthesis protein n=1 Tax=Sporolactobacillus shoreae TaxID=1465501 RepID=A0A4Z0GTP2_9BACL|nr:DUF6270 domain-containing protein [Sporolactobacillus shoreae]TGB00125.1 hypothetical protein E4665_00135 [Sporolactobacillus shoreae]
MTAELLRIKDMLWKDKLIIKGSCRLRTGNGFLMLEERIKGNDLFIPRDIKIPCTVKWGNFSAEIDLQLLSSLQNPLDLWDCFFVCDHNKEEIEIHSESKTFESYRVTERFLMITFYENSRHTLSISVKKNDQVKAELTGVSQKENIFRFKGQITGIKIDQFTHAFLSVRKRENKNSILYQSETDFPIEVNSDHSWSCPFNKQSVFPDSMICHEEVWDLFIKLENDGDSLYLPIGDQAKLDDDYSILSKNTFYQAKLYINRKKCVGLWVKRIPEYLSLKKCFFDSNGQLVLSCASNAHRRIEGFKIEPDQEIWANHFQGFSLIGSVDRHLTSIDLSIPLNRLKNLYKIEKGLQFRTMIEIKDSKTGVLTWMPLFIENELPPENRSIELQDNLDARVMGKIHEPLKIEIVNHISANLYRMEPVKLAILGTCYTRGAFGSNPYFNPGYKSKYDLVYTQFHSSIPSLMSEPVPFPEQFFEGKKPAEKEYISCDFEKNFFTRLSEAKAEYFLLDLYPDAVRDLVVFDDQHIITGTFYLRNRAFLQSIDGKAHFVSHDNEEELLNYWCPAVDRFAEKIVQFFPQERIILQKARMTNRYYDKNRQVHYFTDQLDLYKRSNMFYQFMESYLLKRLPHIHTIDLNHYGYIGQYNHPFGQSTNHFEPDYYKKFMLKLDEIILDQDQKERK